LGQEHPQPTFHHDAFPSQTQSAQSPKGSSDLVPWLIWSTVCASKASSFSQSFSDLGNWIFAISDHFFMD